MAASNRDFERNLARGKVEEKKCAAYLKALGYRVLPTTEFSGSGAPKLEADDDVDSLVMPDLQAFRNGTGAWFECKWKSSATRSDKHDRAETGVGLRHFDYYRRVEHETQTPVVIVFIHEAEREVRCGTLNQLEAVFSHDYRGSKMDRSGMRFWIYERIPLWMPLAELSAAIEAHRYNARLIQPPIEPPIDNKLARTPHAIRRHGSEREQPTKKIFSEAPSWTWACLPCNVTGVGDPGAHRCGDAADWRRDFWIQRLRWTMPVASKDELAQLIAKPIARARIAELLGPRWLASGDVR